MKERTLILLKRRCGRPPARGTNHRPFRGQGTAHRRNEDAAVDDDLAARHYAEHVKKDFYPSLKEFIVSGPVIALALEGDDAVALTRMMMGATRHTEAAPGTIRGRLCLLNPTEPRSRLPHSPERAKVEIGLFFSEDELF